MEKQVFTENWPSNFSEAKAVQASLQGQVSVSGRFDGLPEYVAGVDVAFREGGAVTVAAICVLVYPGGHCVEQVCFSEPTRFPYVPGYLSFRELPAVLAAWLQLRTKPQLVMCDGQGIAHPRRFGIASHLGVLLNLPTIGVAKSRLVGDASEPGKNRGESNPLMANGEHVGWLLRTRTNVKPLYVSPGHLVDIPSSRALVLAAGNGYRLPEPTRLADKLSKTRT
ncbi:deoxyribonuclease V [Teredinibacter turnerae]|uniref:deoxyribonuclease V n=1 Tax=Teredinibacter turnerae TaxID=2426 RepID=UPI000364807E|nr:deoxyribonuclease V [Teredinibacter turnerae]